MANPNQVFKDKEYTGKGLQKITKDQMAAILGLIHHQGYSYRALLLESKVIRLFDRIPSVHHLTYDQAVKIILTAKRTDLPDVIVVVDA